MASGERCLCPTGGWSRDGQCNNEPFDPEQGMAGGAAVNMQMKSGTNQFHGSGVINSIRIRASQHATTSNGSTIFSRRRTETISTSMAARSAVRSG